jgi:Ca-activated chloride channel homolog
VALPSTSCEQKEKILAAIDSLHPGGTTNGGEGIQEAYRVAAQHFIPGGVNRVILCTDGDFNVGLTDQAQLVGLIQEKARTGVFLTTLGVGTDNYKDRLMQQLADRGNGNYHYLDSFEEAHKVLIEQMNANLVTIAKDVKLQVEFNPAHAASYRLIGYEKRLLRNKDFANDAKDAGEMGAGHSVTALYEVVPADVRSTRLPEQLKYQSTTRRTAPVSDTAGAKELLTVKLRFKQPDGQSSTEREFPFTDSGQDLRRASTDLKFAAAVASFGMLLRDSDMAGNSSYDLVLSLAEQARGSDPNGARAEFLQLVRKAKEVRAR